MKLISSSLLAAIAIGSISFQNAHGQSSPLVLAQMMHGEKGMQNKDAQGAQGAPGGTMSGMGESGKQGGSMMQMPKMQMPMMQMMRHGSMLDVPSDYIEGRIAFMHAELRITDLQMAAWTEFANVLRANAKRSAEAHGAKGSQAASTTDDRLDEQERSLTARLEGVRALKAAYGKFYTVLDDKQKKTADELMTMPMAMKMPMGDR